MTLESISKLHFFIIITHLLLILIMVIVMKNISIWIDTVNKTKYPKLNENKEVDVLIIGGGITGASTLYNLKDSNLKVMLVEQNEIGKSVTGKSTGKLNYLQNNLLDKIRNSFGDKKASLYLKSQKDAIKMITDIIEKEKIDCDLERVDSYLYTNKKEEISKIKDLQRFLKKNNIKTIKDKSKLVKNKYMIKVEDTYMFHPIKYVLGLLKDTKYPVYENTSIKEITKEGDHYICRTDKYKIKTKWVVIASHYPYFIFPFLFPIKASIEKSYLSASKKKEKPISLISYSKPFISIRTYKDYLIYLSNSHSVEKDTSDLNNFDELKKKISDLKLKPSYLWSNMDVMTNDGLPYIGRIKDRILIGTGYNTWGLTNGPLAGKILSDIIEGKENEYIELFNPKRFNLNQFIGFIVDTFKSIIGYIKGFNVKNDKVSYETINGKSSTIYEDEEKKHTVCSTCPHAGCKLLLNETEKTWDCPCHGSRFDIDGKCISGPANKDITNEK